MAEKWCVPPGRWVPELGYLLAVGAERLDVLVRDVRIHGWAGESIPVVPDAIRRQPLLCFISADRGAITHVARAVIRYLAESGRHRIDVTCIGLLPRPIRLGRLQRCMSGPQAWRARAALKGAGHLTASTLVLIMDALRKLDAETSEAVQSLVVRDPPSRLDASQQARENWAYQRDAIATALQIAGIDGRRLEIQPQLPAQATASEASIFDSDSDVLLVEDTNILRDLDAEDTDWQFIKRQKYPTKTYRSGDRTLTIILANKLELELQLGVDLIYVNESLRSVVFVQYKMFSGVQGEMGYRPDNQLDIEIARMDSASEKLSHIDQDDSSDGYRFGQEPFFMKFCKKLLSHEGLGTTPALYVPVAYWKRLAKSEAIRGPKGGRVVYEHSFGRRFFTHSHFVELVERGWIGTSTLQTAVLLPYLRAAIEGRRGVVLAVESREPSQG